MNAVSFLKERTPCDAMLIYGFTSWGIDEELYDHPHLILRQAMKNGIPSA